MEVGARQHQSSRLGLLVRRSNQESVPVLGKSFLLLSRAGECHTNFRSKTVAVFFHSKTIVDYFPLSSWCLKKTPHPGPFCDNRAQILSWHMLRKVSICSPDHA